MFYIPVAFSIFSKFLGSVVPVKESVNNFFCVTTQDINRAWGNLDTAEKDLEDWLLTEMRR